MNNKDHPASSTQSVLITGASGGIGAEFARVFAAENHDLILVARSKAKLETLARDLAKAHGVACTVVASDLGEPDAPQALFDEVTAQGLRVDVLVNNAGILHRGPFADTSVNDHLQLLQLNIAAATALCHLFMKPMLERGAGRVLNIASTSAFQPVPQLATYGASKAYLLSLSEALAIECQGTGVSVTALCPGFTETDMIAREGEKSMHLPFIPNLSSAQVAREGFDACMAGKALYINGVGNRLAIELTRHQPAFLRRWVTRHLARRGF